MKKLVAYITCGYPDKEFTVDLAASLKDAGADLLELGIPFSDPVADGPTIEEASFRALANGFKTDWLFEVSPQISKTIDTLWMGYFNSFYKRGMDFFSKKAKECGVSGFIIPDLPYEESLKYKKDFEKDSLALIDFVSPTDTKKRIETIVKDAKKFIYLVAYAGITGVGKEEDLGEVIANIREYSDTPIYTGFGVNEKTAKEKSKGVDGVIVGSSFVKVLLDDSLTSSQKIDSINKIASRIKEEINT